jgi:hypothetical protein
MSAMKTTYNNVVEAMTTKEIAELLEHRLKHNIGVEQVPFTTLVNVMNNIDAYVLDIMARNSGYMTEPEYA